MDSTCWLPLSSPEEVERLLEKSHAEPAAVFKHSPHCGISHRVWSEIHAFYFPAYPLKPYLIDVIAQPEVARVLAHRLGVKHQSPQLLILSKGKCLFHRSHFGIEANRLGNQLGRVLQTGTFGE